jgi:hypothetical protein
MFSLFCVVVCVLAQLINSAVHPAAILLRKRRVVGFIDGDLPFVQNPSNVCNAYAWKTRNLLLLVTSALDTSFASYQLRGCHPAALQSIPRRAQCEMKQLPNRHWRRLPADARHSSGLKPTAAPTERQDR